MYIFVWFLFIITEFFVFKYKPCYSVLGVFLCVLESFFLLFSLWVFHIYTTRGALPALTSGISLESEWQKVSRTLLSILADLNNTVAFMVLIFPLISSSHSHLCSTTFSALWQGPSICQVYRFPLFLLCSSLKWQKSLHDKFFYFCWLKLGLVFWPELCGLFVSQKFPENSMDLIFWDRSWFVHIPFISMVKFQSLIHFPVDHPVVVIIAEWYSRLYFWRM